MKDTRTHCKTNEWLRVNVRRPSPLLLLPRNLPNTPATVIASFSSFESGVEERRGECERRKSERMMDCHTPQTRQCVETGKLIESRNCVRENCCPGVERRVGTQVGCKEMEELGVILRFQVPAEC
ncbi:hypothetical protein BLNAU_22421 [Blattamonas nauphoetae]|uniref:Uncharacterized protein n=1 Tax=Blattamonas nauphoetae TaxID=2049346 RepID=A0ABQ9WT38_9EUKA|nr:hypothetical protein BLNAU_22421 [Blattamonas nauphoetae]